MLDKGADENSVSFFFAQKGGIIAKKYESREENTEKPQNLTSKQQKLTFHVEELDKKPKYRQKFHQPIERMTSSAENVLHVRHTTRKIHSAYRQHHLKPYQEVEKA